MKTHKLKSSNKRNREALGIVDNSKRLNLGLRTLKFEAELKSMPYPNPKNLEEAINLQISLREDSLTAKYNQVFAFALLKKHDHFWLEYGCRSLEEWLSVMDLPTGSTLANREIMVREFSKETFLMVGDTMLGEMMYLIACVQPDTEKRSSDYQNIFTAYCKSYSHFDKTKFREIVNWYINTNYIQKSGKKVDDVKTKPVHKETTKGSTHYKKAIESHSLIFGEVGKKSFKVVETLCAGCKERNKYINKLEAIILRELGEEYLPERPTSI